MDTGFTPVRVELPLEPLEAFRLASFNIEYVPQYAELVMDVHCVREPHYYYQAQYVVRTERPWYEQHLGSPGRQLLMD